MKRIHFLNAGLVVLLLTATFFGCKKDDDNPTYTLQVETGAVTDITATTATASGTMTYDDKTEILSGICWSTEEMPTIEDNVKQKGVIKGSYECSLTGLSPETTYYYRAFAQHGNEIVYGEQKSFTTINGDDPGPEPGDGDGSAENPYNVAQAMQNQNSQTAWVKGYIVGGVKNDDNISVIASSDDVVFGNTNIRATSVLIADSKDETDYTNCVVVNLPSGPIRAAVNLRDNPDNLSKELKINGTLRTYFDISGVRDLTDYELEGEDPGPEPGDVIFSETFATSQGNFIIQNVVKPSEVENVWRHNSQYSQMAAGAYISEVNYATESWLISPEIDLSQVATAIFTFEHAGKQFGAPVSNLTIQVSTTYSGGNINAADWTALSIPNHLAGETNTFKSAGDIDLTSYCGQSKVRVAFKYTSTTSGAGNWYVKNVIVK
ncbi:MAG: DUF5017 domain-containing protein [Lentimicrobiaceae bacterium]|jgi:hypothetical protein|nr:DUF5017 domain-containing protein [Lentimicrobiaceae bacterium]